MKELKDYLHLYLGCEVTDGEDIMTLLSVGIYGYVAKNNDVQSQGIFSRIKPLLRPLSDMTEEERGEFLSLNTTRDNKEQCEANNTVWLLSNHFDLFGLIESGLAIDKNKI